MSRSKYCKYQKLNRSTLYYKPKGESAENLEIMRMMDRYSMEHPTAGVLTMVNMLTIAGMVVNPKRVRRLLRKKGILAVYPPECLSTGGKPVYRQPYLLRGLEITHANHVWSTDIHIVLSDERRIHVPLRHHRCVQPVHRRLATEQHALCHIMPRTIERMCREIWDTRNHQFRSGWPIHHTSLAESA